MKRAARSPAVRSRARGMRSLALAASLAITGCGSDGTGPQAPDPGPLRLMVTQASAGAGGLLVEISGPGVGTATPSYRVWQTEPGSSRTVLFLKGAVQPGPVAQLDVPDRNVAYVARVLDASAGAGGHYERQSPSDFGVELRR